MQTASQNAQLTFLFSHMEDSLKRLLEELLNRPVSLVLTENSMSMLSARMCDGVLRVRLHRMFISADVRVLDEIVTFLKSRRCAMPFFRRFIRDHRALLKEKAPNKLLIKTLGKFHDLGLLYQEVNEEYFGGTIDAAITWGVRSARYAVRKRTLGSFSARSNLIRINPVLDKKAVPRYYVAFVVYHEMLHAALGTPLKGKRRSVHSGEFKKRERVFKDYEKARAWEGGA